MKLYWTTCGYDYRGHVLDKMLIFMSKLLNNGIQVFFQRAEGSFVQHVRERSLGHEITTLDPTKEVYSHPFKGADYDYILLTDSDVLFEYEDFEKLLEADKDCITGIYRMTNGRYCALPYQLPYDSVDWLSKEQVVDLRNRKVGPIEVWHSGLGFTLIKKGVLEKMPLPWFTGSTVILDEKEKYCGEDVYFFNKVRNAGFKVWAHPDVVVGHLKQTII